MLEQKLEKKILDKLESALNAAGVDRMQYMGTWQSSALKSIEEDDIDGAVTVKLNPRAYDGYTTPDARFTASVTIALRADVDYKGMTYLQVCEKLFAVLQQWQTDFSKVEEDLTVDGEFDPSGIVMDGGDAGIDREQTVWTCQQQVTLYGIIAA